MNLELINVGIADLGVATDENVLRTILGSCVGICLYHEEKKIGGLAHIMLPVMKLQSSSPKKYADSAIPMLIEELEAMGITGNELKAKIVGGATMFKLSPNSLMSEIGRNNISKVKDVLAEFGIEVIGEDTGGDYGRTIDFFVGTGEVKVKSINRNEVVL